MRKRGVRPIGKRDGSPVARQNHDLGSDADAAVEIDHVRVSHADTSARHLGADRGRIIGAVDAIIGIAEIQRACTDRIAGAAATQRGK